MIFCQVSVLHAFYTFFSVYKRFSQLNEEKVARDKNAKLSRDEILKLPELQVK